MASVIIQGCLPAARGNALPVFVAGIQHAKYSTDGEFRPINPSLSALKRGTGGRSSFNGVVATVLGSTGFIGRYVINRLGKQGTQVIVPYRGVADEVRGMKLSGDLGQILFQKFDPKDTDSIHKVIKYSNVVINLIGRDWETKNFTFHDVNVKLASTIAKLCKEVGVERLIHASHVSAAEKPESHVVKGGSKYLATKWEGEQAVKQIFPDATIIRMSDVYGQEDRFVRLWSHPWRHQAKGLPLWRKGDHTIKQPVYVGDVAAGFAAAARDKDAIGKTYQAVGPKRYKLSDMVDYFHHVMRKDRENWGYWRYDMKFDPLFKLKVSLTEKGPGTPIGLLCWDRIEREAVTDVYVKGMPTLEDLGITLTHLEDQAEWEFKVHRAFNYYDAPEGEFAPATPPNAIPY